MAHPQGNVWERPAAAPARTPRTAPAPVRAGMLLFGATVLTSAFLLFQVQPLIAKVILPWFGSSPGVWTACMLFFQMLLLGGYAYSHLVVSRLTPRRQGITHLVLLAVALAWLPLAPDPSWRPAAGDEPVGRILLLLAASVGLPYFALSATGPLLQGWFARLQPGRSPYSLYALSNAGSLVALLSYPFLFERVMRLESQTLSWSVLFGVFALLCAVCAWRLVRTAPSGATQAAARPTETPRPRAHELLLWLTLSACGSALLVATTNQMCMDVAVVPFLWVLPLTLYLLSFILCFDHARWYVRPLFFALLPVTLYNMVRVLNEGVDLGIVEQIVGYSATLFVCCMCCHGELARRKPAPLHLTLFFLMLSLGGALGGLFVAVAAPALFDGYYEYHLLLLVCAGVMASLLARRHLGIGALACAGVAALGWALWSAATEDSDAYVARERNFYGVVSLYLSDEGEDDESLYLEHGRIGHGFQYAKRPTWPTSYYGPQNGIGMAIRKHPKRLKRNRQFRIGVIGLGVGTTAAYANARIHLGAADDDYVEAIGRLKPDYVRFYEINPLVVTWARERFTFIRDARVRGADVDVFVGDARIVMERQLERGETQRFDVLAVDAFSSDAVPIHLLTLEALAVYWEHLRDDGILAINISNRFLDMLPVVRRFGRELGKRVVQFDTDDYESRGVDGAHWVLLTSNRRFDPGGAAVEVDPAGAPDDPLWTDDFASLFDLIERDEDE